MPDIKQHTIAPITHAMNERQEHIRRAIRPLGRSLSIERSERFPHCLLEIPLATLWPKQTLRLANRTYLPVFVFPRRLQPIYYSCVCAIIRHSSLKPHYTNPHSHRRLPPRGPGHKEILWGSFAEAVKGVPDADEFKKHREDDADCRRCGRNGPKTRVCFAQITAKGTKLAPPPKLPSGKASAIRTKRIAEAEREPEKEVEKAAAVPRPIKKARMAATQRKVWEVETSDSERESDNEMPDFP